MISKKSFKRNRTFVVIFITVGLIYGTYHIYRLATES